MGRKRTAFYYMTAQEKKEYFRQKNRECNERKAIIRGYPIRHQDPNSHPSQMSYEERLAYNRDALRRHFEKQK